MQEVKRNKSKIKDDDKKKRHVPIVPVQGFASSTHIWPR